MSEKIAAAVLGATGAVGQRFVSLLAGHPWFEVVSLTGSSRTQGASYREGAHWVIPGEMPAEVQDLILQPSEDPGDVGLIFSALPSSAARRLEPALAARGYPVVSNASAFRMQGDIPLLIPFINPDHLGLIQTQRANREWPGLLVTSPNCSTTGIVFPLKSLHEAFGVSRATVVTMQAISGAGYPGVSSFDIQDNVVPLIEGEDEKIESEPCKLLGVLADGRIVPAPMAISAHANRVPVTDGHLASISLELEQRAELDEVIAALGSFKGQPEVAALPSAPPAPMILRQEQDRPQPRRDRDTHKGMAVTVGRVRGCPVFDYKLISLVHNTLLGAAGGAILNAEWLAAQGYLGDYPG